MKIEDVERLVGERRIGKFFVPIEALSVWGIRGHPEVSRAWVALLLECFQLHTDYQVNPSGLEVTALHPSFEPVSEREITPRYWVHEHMLTIEYDVPTDGHCARTMLERVEFAKSGEQAQRFHRSRPAGALSDGNGDPLP